MYRRIIVITGMPRSGTAWLSMTLDSCAAVRYRQSPLFSYEFKNYCDESSSKQDWEYVFRGSYESDNEFMNQTKARQSGEFPTFKNKSADPEVLLIKFDRFQNLTERLLDLFSDLKAVAAVRHPCGAIHSWLSAPREFPSEADPLRYWRSGAIKKSGPGDHFGFEDWKATTRQFMKLASRYPARFRLQRYEALVMNPIPEAKSIFAFLNLEYTDQTTAFLMESHSRHEAGPYAVFKNPAVKDRWREEMNPEIRDAILKDLRGTDLEIFLED